MQTAHPDATNDDSAPAQRRDGRWLPKWVGPVATALAVAGFCLWLYEEALEDVLVPRNFGQVQPGLYRSGLISEQLMAPTLHQNDIDVIVALTAEDPADPRFLAEERASRRLGIERFHYPLAGNGTGDPMEYSAAITKVVESRKVGKNVLVHCAAGAERAGGTIALYRVLVEGDDPAAAVETMMYYKHDPHRNPEMIPFLNQHMGAIADDLVARGVLAQRPDPLPLFRKPG